MKKLKTESMLTNQSVLNKVSPNTIKGYRALLASAFSFSIMTVCVKHLGTRIPIAEIVLARAMISIIITKVMIKKAKVCSWGVKKRLLLLRGLLGTTALFCVFKAISSLPLAAATVLQYTYPIFTTIAASILLNEEIGKRIFLGIGVGWAGITLVVQTNWPQYHFSSLPFESVCIALGGALLTALAYVSVRKLSETEHPLVIVYYFPLVSIPICLPLLSINAVMPSGVEWIWLLGVGIFTQLGQIWITEGLSILPAGHASSINYCQVLFASIWGIILFNEPISRNIIIGAILILSSTLLSISSNSSKPLKNEGI